MRLGALAQTWQSLRATRSRKEKAERLAELLRSAGPAQAPYAAAWMAGHVPPLGVGPSALRDARFTPALESEVELSDLAALHGRLTETSGPGSKRARQELLGAFLTRCSELEQRFCIGLWLGALRQGSLESAVLDGLSRAADVPLDRVRRAMMLSGDLQRVTRAALEGGAPRLDAFRLELFRPLSPMLASPAENLEDGLALERPYLEVKMDGARIQLHKDGDDVRIYSRLLNDVTPALPELVSAARALSARQVVLDGEAIGFDPSGRPLPFQRTMRRFGRKRASERTDPLEPRWFDALHVDGEDLFDAPATQRLQALDALVDGAHRVERLHGPSSSEARAFFTRARAEGHEGLMAKSASAPYAAGRRGAQWLKIKEAETVDLVVLAAEWGSGRRKGWLSNLHLGAPNGRGAFIMLGKTFKGLTDALLREQTAALLALEVRREDHIVWVQPKLVVEIAFNEIQQSARYPGGLALRFARVRRYRPDRTPDSATPFSWFEQRASSTTP